jgi:hypothetical protein
MTSSGRGFGHRKTRADGMPHALLARHSWLGLLPVFTFFLVASLTAHAQSSMSEYQVKAQFLLNFVKYVDWPSDAPTSATIGILGQDNLSDDLQRVAEGKTVNGRTIVIKHIPEDGDLSGCTILFVSASEASRLAAILGKTDALPILTVGEDASFLQNGGIVNFVLKDGRVRLEINLKAARQVKLEISSKLLSVADEVEE